MDKFFYKGNGNANLKECSEESEAVLDGFVDTWKLIDPDSFPKIQRPDNWLLH